MLGKKSTTLNWDLDYKPDKGDRTGYNLISNGLVGCSWFDVGTDQRVSRKKLPRSVKDFAKLNKPEQSHLIAQVFQKRELCYFKSTDQYGKQVQRYFRKLYKQQFRKMPTKMQLKVGRPRDFDLSKTLSECVAEHIFEMQLSDTFRICC